jgi:hypothetical protein
MNLTEELRKLSELHQEGHLTDQEFTEAKRKLISGCGTESAASREGLDPTLPAESGIPEKCFQSSRWSASNFFFPDRLTLASDGMLFRKGSLFGSTAEHINYRSVASFKVTNGVFLASITIETSGGSQPIFMNGIWKSDAREIEATLRVFQRGAA